MRRWGSEPTMIIEWAVRQEDGALHMMSSQEAANTYARHRKSGVVVHRSIAIDKWRTYEEALADVPWGRIAQEGDG